jgi:hypothetical protein
MAKASEYNVDVIQGPEVASRLRSELFVFALETVCECV